MKKVEKLVLVVLVLSVFACSKEKADINVEGNYTLSSQEFYLGDSLASDLAVAKQIKFFTNQHWMFIGFRGDSTVAFSAGTYSINEDMLTEQTLTSNPDSAGSDFMLRIEMTDNGYRQIIDEMVLADGEVWKLDETYERNKVNEASDLDGLYRLTKSVNIAEGDTSETTYHEFKMISKGEFLWGAQSISQDGSVNNYVGQGKITVNGDEVTEVLEDSNMEGITGIYPITIERTDSGFTQTITNSTTNEINKKTYTKIQK